jgi:methyl-accepting chemotaxis protein
MISARYRLYLFLWIPLLIILGVSLLTDYYTKYRLLLEGEIRISQQVLWSVQAGINGQFEECFALARTLAALSQSTTISETQRRRAYERLLNADSQYCGLFYIDETHEFYIKVDSQDPSKFTYHNDVLVEQRSLLIQAQQKLTDSGNSPVGEDIGILSEPYIGLDGSRVLSFFWPMVHLGKVTGCIGLELRDSFLEDFLAKVAQLSGLFAIVISPNRMLIADNIPLEEDPAFFSALDLLPSGAHVPKKKIIQHVGAFDEVQAGGRTYWLLSGPLNHEMGSAIVGLPKDRFEESVSDSIRTSFIYFFLVLMLLVIATYVLWSRGFEKIESLFVFSQRILEGDYDALPTIKGGGIIGSLMQAFRSLGLSVLAYKQQIGDAKRDISSGLHSMKSHLGMEEERVRSMETTCEGIRAEANELLESANAALDATQGLINASQSTSRSVGLDRSNLSSFESVLTQLIEEKRTLGLQLEAMKQKTDILLQISKQLHKLSDSTHMLALNVALTNEGVGNNVSTALNQWATQIAQACSDIDSVSLELQSRMLGQLSSAQNMDNALAESKKDIHQIVESLSGIADVLDEFAPHAKKINLEVAQLIQSGRTIDTNTHHLLQQARQFGQSLVQWDGLSSQLRRVKDSFKLPQ